jgi:hypothetical protein
MKIKKNRIQDTVVISHMFQFQNELKLYHWNTYSYSRHRSTDHLFEELIEFIDEFIEIYMGRFHRLKFEESSMDLSIRIFQDKNAHLLLDEFVVFLETLEDYLPQKRNISSLMNKRDEIVGHVYQTLYLFSLH